MRPMDNSAGRLKSRNALTRRGFIPALASRAIVVRFALRWPSLVAEAEARILSSAHFAGLVTDSRPAWT